MANFGCIMDLGNTLMSIPEEADEEERLASLLQLPNASAVRAVIYRVCSRFPKLTLEQFILHFVEAIGRDKDPELKSEIATVLHNSIDAAVLTDGALEVLDGLRARNVRLALVSNTSPASHNIIDKLDLRRRFHSVVFSCDVGYLKPDPRIFRHALNAIGSDPEHTVVVGDKIRTDILGGAIVGLKSILIETRMKRVVEDGRSYVNAIVPHIKDVPGTMLIQEIFK